MPKFEANVLTGLLNPGNDLGARREQAAYSHAADTLLDRDATFFEKGASVFNAILTDVTTVTEAERREIERQEEVKRKAELERKEDLELERQRRAQNSSRTEINTSVESSREDDPLVVDGDEMELRTQLNHAVTTLVDEINAIENAGDRRSAIVSSMGPATLEELTRLASRLADGVGPGPSDGMESVGSQEISAMERVAADTIRVRDSIQAAGGIGGGAVDSGPEIVAQLDRDNPDLDPGRAGSLFSNRPEEFDAQLDRAGVVTLNADTELHIVQGDTPLDVFGERASGTFSLHRDQEIITTLHSDGTVELGEGTALTFNGTVDEAGWRERFQLNASAKFSLSA